MGLILGWPHANFLYTSVASVSHTIYGFPLSCFCAYILRWTCTDLIIFYIYVYMWMRLIGSADCTACNVQQATAAAATGSGSLASWRLTPHYPSLSVSICPTLFLPHHPSYSDPYLLPHSPTHKRWERFDRLGQGTNNFVCNFFWPINNKLFGLCSKTALSLCQNGQYRVNAGSNSLLKWRAPGKKESNLL